MSEQHAILDAINAVRNDVREVREILRTEVSYEKDVQQQFKKTRRQMMFGWAIHTAGLSVIVVAIANGMENGWHHLSNGARQVGQYVSKLL